MLFEYFSHSLGVNITLIRIWVRSATGLGGGFWSGILEFYWRYYIVYLLISSSYEQSISSQLATYETRKLVATNNNISFHNGTETTTNTQISIILHFSFPK